MSGPELPESSPSIGREALAVFPVFAAITYLTYWPAFNDACCSVFVPTQPRLTSDVNLVQWILATIARSLAANPFELFRGDIFFPFPNPITAAEHMLGQQLFFAPLLLVSGNPVWSLQWTIFLNSALCGVGMYLLLRHWQVAVPAALLAGFVYAMFPSRYFGIHAPNVYAAQYLPLAILFLDRSVDRASRADAVCFAIVLALQMLTSFYLAYISVCAVVCFSIGKVLGEGRFDWRAWLGVALAGVIASVPVLVMALPYLAQASEGGFRDHASGHLTMMSNSPWKSFLYPTIATRSWGWRQYGMPNYLGILPVGLALVGCGALVERKTRGATVGLLLVLVVTYLFSLGPTRSADAWLLGRPYEWAEAWLPGFSIMRVPSRFAAGVMLAVAALAGMGLDRLLARAPSFVQSRLVRFTAAAVLGLLVALEFGLFHYRLSLRQPPLGATIPPVYQALGERERGPVLEVPGGVLDGANVLKESEYTYLSIFHRQPLLNGYSGYRPPTYTLLMSLARALPDAHALDLLRRLTGLRYVVLHEAALPPVERQLWREHPGLERIGTYGKDVLFELPAGAADLRSALLDNAGAGTTVLGTRLASLRDEERLATIRLDPRDPLAGADGARLRARQVRRSVRVEVRNDSTVIWPVLSVDPAHVVHWAYRWYEWIDDRWVGVGWDHRIPLAYDLKPGASTSATLRVLVPPYRGRFRLSVGIEQGEKWFADPLTIDGMIVESGGRAAARAAWRIQGAK